MSDDGVSTFMSVMLSVGSWNTAEIQHQLPEQREFMIVIDFRGKGSVSSEMGLSELSRVKPLVTRQGMADPSTRESC